MVVAAPERVSVPLDRIEPNPFQPRTTENPRLAAAPFYLHNRQECMATCTWGAQLGQEEQGHAVELFCTNKKCFEGKVQQGADAFKAEQDKRLEAEALVDQSVVDALTDRLHDWAAPLVASAFLVASGDFEAISPFTAKQFQGLEYEDRKRFSYQPSTLVRVRDLLGLKQVKEKVDTWRESTVFFSRREALGKLEHLDAGEAAQVAANLVVYALRHRADNGIAFAQELLGLAKEGPHAK